LCAAIVDRLTVGGDIIETCPPQPKVTPGFTDTTDRNGRDARIQALGDADELLYSVTACHPSLLLSCAAMICGRLMT
jgi:hypothetical protein